jgi:hypothetical protein
VILKLERNSSIKPGLLGQGILIKGESGTHDGISGHPEDLKFTQTWMGL